MNERVGFFVSIEQRRNLLIFFFDLGAQKYIFIFEQSNKAVVYRANSRVRSRLFVAVRWLLVVIFQDANGRVRSRLVATSRVRSHFII